MDRSSEAAKIRAGFTIGPRAKATGINLLGSRSETFKLSPEKSTRPPAGLPGRNPYILPDSPSSPNFRGAMHNMASHSNFETHIQHNNHAPWNLTPKQTNAVVEATWRTAGRFEVRPNSSAGSAADTRAASRIVAPADSRVLARPERMQPAGSRGVGNTDFGFKEMDKRPGAGGYW